MIIFTRPFVIIALLGLFSLAAMTGGPSNGLERTIMQAIAEFRAGRPNLTEMVVGITNLGGAYVTLGVTAGASLWLLLRRSTAPALLLVLSVLIERVLMDALKAWIGRPRPNFGVDWLPQSLAFPSGHSANSMTDAGWARVNDSCFRDTKEMKTNGAMCSFTKGGPKQEMMAIMVQPESSGTTIFYTRIDMSEQPRQ